MLKVLGHGLAVVLLTAVTQIGGLAYLAALLLRATLFRRSRYPATALLLPFLLFYGGATLALRTEMFTTRIPLSCASDESRALAAASPLLCLLNRNYVSADLYHALEALSGHMDQRFPGTLTQVLDTGFPFFDNFPLLPPLSHDDGRKADLAFYYRDGEGEYRRGLLASPLGYWGFTPPRPGEPQPCAGGGSLFSLRWDMGWFQPLVRDDISLDAARTKAALEWLTSEGRLYGIEKILLEPHLKSRLGLTSDRIRFQGCGAARHDDHIHVETNG